MFVGLNVYSPILGVNYMKRLISLTNLGSLQLIIKSLIERIFLKISKQRLTKKQQNPYLTRQAAAK